MTRAKDNLQCCRIYSNPCDIEIGVLFDQVVRLTGVESVKGYPNKLRYIHFYDKETKRHLYFLTNDFLLPALTIAKLYKARWSVELFFKWIKQHLRIKKFYGLSENAVKTQIWIAISIYVTIAIVKKKLNLEQSLYTILQVVSLCLFEKMPIIEAFQNECYETLQDASSIQLNLFDL